MRILALDLGTQTGYAFDSDSGVRHSGSWDFQPKRFDSSGMRFVRFENELQKLHNEFLFDMVYYEEVNFAKTTHAAQIWGGFQAVLTTFCEKKFIKYQGVPVATLKKHATGKGNADKLRMIGAARSAGWPVKDDDEADACWLLDFAKKEFPTASKTKENYQPKKGPR